MPTSPAGQGRADRLDRALDADRAGNGLNRARADQQLQPSHEGRSANTPNTGNGKVAGS